MFSFLRRRPQLPPDRLPLRVLGKAVGMGIGSACDEDALRDAGSVVEDHAGVA